MSWASHRQTTRTEDLAYCLLGLFDINMPLLYGEGDKAFIRLQEEIMKNSDDQSMFAWGYSFLRFPESPYEVGGLRSFAPFAREPAAFRDSGHIIPDKLEPPPTAFTLTNRGLQISLRIRNLSRYSCPIAILACRLEGKWPWLIGIPIRFRSNDSFLRLGSHSCFPIRRDEISNTSYRPLQFLRNDDSPPQLPRLGDAQPQGCLIRKFPSHDISDGLSYGMSSLVNFGTPTNA
jgi:hypothetical protein